MVFRVDGPDHIVDHADIIVEHEPVDHGPGRAGDHVGNHIDDPDELPPAQLVVQQHTDGSSHADVRRHGDQRPPEQVFQRRREATHAEQLGIVPEDRTAEVLNVKTQQ